MRILLFASLLGALSSGTNPARAEDAAVLPAAREDIVVTASRVDLLGKALTASQGSITRKEVELRPIYRPGQ